MAQDAYRRALAVDPQEAAALYLLGVLCFEDGRAAEAVQYLQTLTERRPNNVQGWLALASARHWLGQHAGAEAAYRAALGRDPAQPAALTGLSNVLRESGQTEAAHAAAAKAVRHAPALAASHAALAAAEVALSHPHEAAAAWREAVRLDPSPAHQVGLALALIDAGDPVAALQAADAALDQDDGLAQAWFGRGAALGDLGQAEAAIEALNRSIALDDGRAAAHLALGAAYAELERLPQAETELNRAIALDPRSAEAHANLGAVYLMADRSEAARAAYESALAVDPMLVTAHQNLAALKSEAGDLAGARRHRQRAYARQTVFIDAAPAPAPRVLILSTGEGGNTPTRHLLPKGRYARISWVIAHATPDQLATPPEHDIVFNGVGDPDLAGPSAANVATLEAASTRPWLNRPEAIARTARERMAERLGDIEGLLAPRTLRVRQGSLRGAAGEAGLDYPLLLRPVGSHGGKGLKRLDSAEALSAAQPQSPGELFLTAFHDYRSADGFYRKHRMIFVDRVAYPYHLAIAPDWMVHHGAAGMADDPARIAEELRFLEDPAGVIGAAAMAAVAEVGRRLDLDYAGIDFAVLPDGRVLVFEANATMLVHPEPPDGAFAAKNRYVARIIEAFQAMVANLNRTAT